MSVGGGQMQQQWIELDAQIEKLRVDCMSCMDAGDKDTARTHWNEMVRLINSRSQEHVAHMEAERGILTQ